LRLLIFIIVSVLVIIAASVVVGKMLSRPRERPLSRESRMTALKASGALKHRKSNRD